MFLLFLDRNNVVKHSFLHYNSLFYHETDHVIFFDQSQVLLGSLTLTWNEDHLHFDSEVCGVNSLVFHQRRLETVDFEPIKSVL